MSLEKVKEALEFYARQEANCIPAIDALTELQNFMDRQKADELLTPVEVSGELRGSFTEEQACDIAEYVYQPLLNSIKVIKQGI